MFIRNGQYSSKFIASCPVNPAIGGETSFQTDSGTLMAPALKAVFPVVDTEKKTVLVVREKLEEVCVRS